MNGNLITFNLKQTIDERIMWGELFTTQKGEVFEVFKVALPIDERVQVNDYAQGFAEKPAQLLDFVASLEGSEVRVNHAEAIEELELYLAAVDHDGVVIDSVLVTGDTITADYVLEIAQSIVENDLRLSIFVKAAD